MAKLTALGNYRDFDKLVTCKIFGFETVEEYYIKTSSHKDIEHLKIPSIFFNATNDKLSPSDTIDLDTTFRKNPNLILLRTRWGGHVCWFTGFRHPKRVKIFTFSFYFL